MSQSLLRAGWSVWGLSHAAPEPGALTDDERRAIHWDLGDIRSNDAIAGVLDAAQPDAVFHLAGLAYVPAAVDDPVHAYDVNLLGAVRLLAAIRTRRAAGTLDPVVLLVGSGEQYGAHDPSDMPLSESMPTHPATVYATTKAAQELAGLQAARADGTRVVLTRSFNHSGRGQTGDFVMPATIRRVLALRTTRSCELLVGNLSAVRDFLHVADVAAAYLALVERGTPGEVYNVCSGTGWSIEAITKLAIERAGVEAELVTDQSLLRPVDVPSLIGSPARLQTQTGWAPRLGVPDIIDDLIHAATH